MLKEYLYASTAELLYGSSITVPRDFIAPADDTVATAKFLKALRQDVAALRPKPAKRHGAKRMNVLDNLRSAD